MCGIAGFWGEAFAEPVGQTIAGEMAGTLKTRGPDSRGTWVDSAAGLGLGHQRLAIVDLSPCGHQPMVSAGGRYVVAFNGEIYNFASLRAELEGSYPFRGHSDTDVLLAAVEAWGVRRAVDRFVGMFAFALWDRQERALTLVRDRLGIKPLYYGCAGGTLLFASELKAFSAHPRFSGRVDRAAVRLLLQSNCIPAPFTIFEGISKLLPGSLLTLRSPAGPASPVRFWSAEEAARRGLAEPFQGSEEEALAELESMLTEAVALRMIADVPIGAFLSGGIDSSAVVALMQAQSSRPVKTFSIGFESEGYDEARHAKEVARHLGTEHTEWYVTPRDALEIIPRLPAIYDEPFADSSQIPTVLVSQLARRHVTVALSGDGGDELFAGYNRHVWGKRVGAAVRLLPLSFRRTLGHGVSSVSPAGWDAAYERLAPLLPSAFRHRLPGEKLHKLADAFTARDGTELYRRFSSHWANAEAVVRGAGDPARHPPTIQELGGVTEQMMLADLATYLPDDILTKVDRASMSVSLEARVPLLDHRVVELAWRLPLSMKLRGGQGKWLLRQLLYRHVPRELIERPKMGFGVPMETWLRGPLRGWAEELLDERRLREEGFFDPTPIRAKWSEHLSGRRNWQHHLWDVLMFQAWLEHQPVAASS